MPASQTAWPLYIEAALGEPNCIRLKRAAGRDAARIDELDKQRLRFAGVPGQFSRSVGFIPGWVRRDGLSLVGADGLMD